MKEPPRRRSRSRSPDARRAALYRGRRKRRVRVLHVEVEEGVPDRMARAGALTAYDLESDEALAYGVGQYLNQTFAEEGE